MARRSIHCDRIQRPSSTPARRKGVPLSPLAKRMLHDMRLAGMSQRTQESYLRAVRKFAQWLNKSPAVASENDLRRYLLFIKNDQQWEFNSPESSGYETKIKTGDRSTEHNERMQPPGNRPVRLGSEIDVGRRAVSGG